VTAGDHRDGLDWPPLEAEQGDKPLQGLDGAAVAPGRTPKTLFRLREPALPDRDLPNDCLGVHIPWIGSARLPQSISTERVPATSKQTCKVLRRMVTAANSGILAVTLPPSESRSRSQLVNTFAKPLQDGLQGLDPRPIG
jgi:hypothetical protein